MTGLLYLKLTRYFLMVENKKRGGGRCRLAGSSFNVTHLLLIEWGANTKYRKIRVHVKYNKNYTFVKMGVIKENRTKILYESTCDSKS